MAEKNMGENCLRGLFVYTLSLVDEDDRTPIEDIPLIGVN
ncbi:hypothetical protein ANME2D_02362 [Candidatus Methanoperedens nitroreducens]|uniref:Uncharacterized protein n=1 Tax=Candidatus Methanoperedens nitratireducens TaxID=1392998 RepID=A0A062V2N0_9EURY|nr:hypothetical protein ANME2D_02362 [Candidatus Methanoperedens nitroreducens]